MLPVLEKSKVRKSASSSACKFLSQVKLAGRISVLIIHYI